MPVHREVPARYWAPSHWILKSAGLWKRQNHDWMLMRLENYAARCKIWIKKSEQIMENGRWMNVFEGVLPDFYDLSYLLSEKPRHRKLEPAMCWIFSPEWSLIKLVIPVGRQLIYYQIDKWCQYNQVDVFLTLTNWYQWFTKWLLSLWTQLTEVTTQPGAEVHRACSSLDQLGLADDGWNNLICDVICEESNLKS